MEKVQGTASCQVQARRGSCTWPTKPSSTPAMHVQAATNSEPQAAALMVGCFFGGKPIRALLARCKALVAESGLHVGGASLATVPWCSLWTTVATNQLLLCCSSLAMACPVGCREKEKARLKATTTTSKKETTAKRRKRRKPRRHDARG